MALRDGGILAGALLALLLPVTVGAADIGRLFSMPAERAALDAQRQQGPRATGAPAAIAAGGEITLDGVIVRKGGGGMVWLNGATAPVDTELPAGVRGPGRSGQVTVALPQGGRAVQLKPGQTLDATSGRVQESYEASGGRSAATAGAQAE